MYYVLCIFKTIINLNYKTSSILLNFTQKNNEKSFCAFVSYTELTDTLLNVYSVKVNGSDSTYFFNFKRNPWYEQNWLRQTQTDEFHVLVNINLKFLHS